MPEPLHLLILIATTRVSGMTPGELARGSSRRRSIWVEGQAHMPAPATVPEFVGLRPQKQELGSGEHTRRVARPTPRYGHRLQTIDQAAEPPRP